jgi:hypothetical protein
MTRFSSRFLCWASVLVLGLSLGLLVSCSSEPSGPDIKTIRWENDGAGYLRFYTNDASNLGFGFWRTYTNTNSPTTFPASIVTATVKKMSGAENFGYGVAFACTGNSNLYRAFIDCTGYYRIDKIVNGSPTVIQAWGPNAAVLPGYGVLNEIAVTYSAPNYSVRINGTLVSTFAADATLGTAGSSGFFVGIGSSADESFPETPVDVRYKMTAPIFLP